jgi:hypothetical protein
VIESYQPRDQQALVCAVPGAIATTRWLDQVPAKSEETGKRERLSSRIPDQAFVRGKAHVTKDRYIKAFDPAVLAAMKRMETTLDAMKVCAPTVHQIN